jgi:hypothetical protein
MSLFQRHCHVIVMGYESRRIVCHRTGIPHLCTVSIAVYRPHQLPHALHLHSLRRNITNAIGIQLDPHGLRIKIIEIDLYLKDVLPIIGLQLHFAKA